MIATRDIGAYAADRLLKLDFNGKQAQELLGERDLSMIEVTSAIARGIGRPELRYVQFSYEQVEDAMAKMGIPGKSASYFVEVFKGFNTGLVTGIKPRSATNATPTSIDTFVKEVFVPAYQGKAIGA
jgi:uncharacterized protein YbjT (DUF2867 family)